MGFSLVKPRRSDKSLIDIVELSAYQGIDINQAIKDFDDDEFKRWHLADNKEWWENHVIGADEGLDKTVHCEDCKEEIKTPEDYVPLSGSSYHLVCALSETRHLVEIEKPYIERLRKVFPEYQ